MMNKCNIVLLVVSLLFSSSLIAGTIDVTKRGAKGDGVTDNTIIIQKAVDECSKKGGGTVLIPSGSYLIRPIELKSNVNLHLDFGTLLLGSTRLSDYDHAFPFKDGTMNQSSGLLLHVDRRTSRLPDSEQLTDKAEIKLFNLAMMRMADRSALR